MAWTKRVFTVGMAATITCCWPCVAQTGTANRPLYTITRGTPAERNAIASQLVGLNRLDGATRDRVISAWVSALQASPYRALEAAPYSPGAPTYKLIDHVNETVELGLRLADYATKKWKTKVDISVLLPALMLHDVDKPILLVREGDRVVVSPLAKAHPHGVLGSEIVRDVGFSEKVVKIVATHAHNATAKSVGMEDYILHYADFFSADHAIANAGGEPYYIRQ